MKTKISFTILCCFALLALNPLSAQNELIETESGILLGSALTTQDGVIQKTSDDIEGYNAGTWNSLINVNPNYTSSSSLNNAAYSLPDQAWYPVGPATTVVKVRENSVVELEFDSTVEANLVGGFGIRFELRMDALAPDFKNWGVYKLNSPPVQTSAKSIYTNLPAGTYTARLWANAANAGSSATNLILDSGGWGARILITEY